MEEKGNKQWFETLTQETISSLCKTAVSLLSAPLQPAGSRRAHWHLSAWPYRACLITIHSTLRNAGNGRLIGSFTQSRSNVCANDISHIMDHLVGLVVKASASRAEDPGFESCLRRDFFGLESGRSRVRILLAPGFFRGRVIPVT